MEERDIEIQCDLSKISNPVLSFDKRRLEQVLYNLINNAVKFTKHGSIVITGEVIRRGKIDAERTVIQSEVDDQEFELKISVADCGIGISEEDINQVFTPFFKTHNKKSKTLNPYGNGIGLSLCKQIC